MSGEFFSTNREPPHHCELPDYYAVRTGWRCDCGKAYVVELLPLRDTKTGESHWQWRRATEYDRATELTEDTK